MKKNYWMMAVMLASLAQGANAAGPGTASAATGLACGSADVLQGLAGAVQSTNRLKPGLIYNFEDVKVLPTTKGSKGMTCEALLQLMEGEDKRLVDTVKLVYTVKPDAKGKGFTIAFEPKR